ncbi:hypothetical protein CSHISOI_11578, partial [Colletotrichum shisoi]
LHDWKHWCDRGIAQRAWQALSFVRLPDGGELYAIGQSGSRWCPGRWATAGRIARRIPLTGEPLEDPCWLEKNDFTESQLYAETVYGTEYGMRNCARACEINAALTRPDGAPAWSPWLYNNGLFAADGTHQMEEQTLAVWHDDDDDDDSDSPTGGYWQRHWRDISPERENTHSVWVEYNEDRAGEGWYPKVKEPLGNKIYKTNIPDAKTKQFLARLDGGKGDRVPLSNPRGADQAYRAIGVLRTNATREIVPDTRGGIKNRALGFSYPTAVQVGDRLLVAYSENKENIWNYRKQPALNSTMEPDRLLYTGATGFVGGTVLSQLLNTSNPQIKGLAITALVRKKEQADLLRQRGVDAVVFQGPDDSEFLRKTASQYDYVIHTPTGFHNRLGGRPHRGARGTQEEDGQGRLLHPPSNLAERTITKETMTPGPVHEWSDKEDVVGFEERKEAEEAYGQRTGVKTYIMMPPTIYGRGTGLFNQGSMQIPSVIRARRRSRGPRLVFGKILAGEEIPSGRRGIYFSNTGSHSWRDMAGHVGRAGVALGAFKAAEPRSVTLDEVAAKWLKAPPPQVAEMNYAA